MNIPRSPRNVAFGVVRNIPLTNNVFDGTQLTDDEVIQEFNKFTSAIDSEYVEEAFYGGIATDITERDAKHGLSGHILCIDVGSKERCEEIERRLNADLNVYIGENEEVSAGNGARQTTHLVYLLPRCHKDFRY